MKRMFIPATTPSESNWLARPGASGEVTVSGGLILAAGYRATMTELRVTSTCMTPQRINQRASEPLSP